MAQVIRLDERLAKQPRRPCEPCEAKILLFTGVRYERWTSNEDRPPRRSSGGKRRKS